MSTVIVPLDGSERGETAIPTARVVAGDGPLLLLTTRQDSASGPAEYLDRVRAGLTGVDARPLLIHDREAADAILLANREHEGSLVCMATHGRSGLGEAVLGSVAESVVRAAEHPVVLVGPHVDHAPDPSADLLVAVDSPSTAAAVATPAVELAGRLSTGLTVLEVMAAPPTPFSGELDMSGWPGEGEAADAAVKAIADLGGRADRRLVREVDPARAIVACARELPASFVVVGTHARAGLARIALGSIAMRVIHRAPCPVVVVRA